MRPKTLNRKLMLGKKTISNLTAGTMGDVRGGTTVYTCSCHYTDCLQDYTCGPECLSVNPDMCPQ